jgi:hypothetical protein
MHHILGDVLALAVGGVYWIALFAYLPLYNRFSQKYDGGWRHGVLLIGAFVFAGLCAAIAALFFENVFHVRILADE